jgi:hypothetical protein
MQYDLIGSFLALNLKEKTLTMEEFLSLLLNLCYLH